MTKSVDKINYQTKININLKLYTNENNYSNNAIIPYDDRD